MANQVVCSRSVALVATLLSFVYHVLLAIYVNYVPVDSIGAGVTLWIYSWTSCVIGYFGVIGIVAVSRFYHRQGRKR
jgi:hypothetical protein